MSLFDKLYLNILQQKILWFSLAIVSSWIYSARNTLNEDLQEGVINLEYRPKTDDLGRAQLLPLPLYEIIFIGHKDDLCIKWMVSPSARSHGRRVCPQAA